MGSLYFASIGYASPLTHDIKVRHPDLPGYRATGLHQYNHSLAELPSCVTPSLDYYQIGSQPNPHHNPKATAKAQVVSITRFIIVALARAREYQPVVHRLRLSASP
jgi:hypothetical protein